MGNKQYLGHESIMKGHSYHSERQLTNGLQQKQNKNGAFSIIIKTFNCKNGCWFFNRRK